MTPRHDATPTPFETFAQLLPPTPDEVAGMLQDLKRKLRGGWREVGTVTGQPVRTLCQWATSAAKPSRAASRHIWLVWSLLCRPGEVTTVFHLSTCGRFTRRADPHTAGERLGNRKPGSAPPPESCPECGQELPP